MRLAQIVLPVVLASWSLGLQAQGFNRYLMTNDGKLRFKAFSQSNDRNLNQLNQAQTTQGAGLAYREEFNTLSEFFTKVGNLFRGKAKQRVVE